MAVVFIVVPWKATKHMVYSLHQSKRRSQSEVYCIVLLCWDTVPFYIIEWDGSFLAPKETWQAAGMFHCGTHWR
jgi:hypothetical protein